MATQRQKRVQEMLVQEISDIVRRDLKDPRIGFVTITDAEVTPDLRHARVYFSVLGATGVSTDEEREETGAALNRAAGFVRSEFARRAQMRYVPDIRFHYDPSADRGARISQLLEQARQHDAGAAGSGSGDGGDDPEGE
ncbi:MAG: 30S ribosome-binding factor RbfA [Armatimonadota bacterium]